MNIEPDAVITAEETKSFTVDGSLINQWEKVENLQFTPLAIKQVVDSWIEQVGQPSEHGWLTLKESDDHRMWARVQGIDAEPSIPLVQQEFHFPEIDDPRVILAALHDFRHQFDAEGNQSLDELVQFRNQNTVAYHIVGHRTIVSARDVIEKHFFFQASKAVEDLDSE